MISTISSDRGLQITEIINSRRKNIQWSGIPEGGENVETDNLWNKFIQEACIYIWEE